MKYLLYHTLKFFLIDIHLIYLRTIYRIVINLSHQFGIGVMILNLYKPLFGFPGFSARISGVVFRLSAILVGIIIIIGFVILSFAIYPLGIYLFYLLITNYPLLLFSIIIGFVLAYFYRLSYLPVITVNKANSNVSLRFSGAHKTRKILSLLQSQNSLGGVKLLDKSSHVKTFNNLCEINHEEIFKYIKDVWEPIDAKDFSNKVREKSIEVSSKYITDEIIFVVLLEFVANIEKYLEIHEANLEYVESALKYWTYIHRHEPTIFDDDYKISPGGGVDKSWATGYTAELNKYSVDYTKLALKGYMPKLVGREKVKENVINILSKPGRNSVLIIGEAGCGKTTFVKGLANDLARGSNIPTLSHKRIVALDIGALTSGSQGEINERLTKILHEISDAQNVILFVDEIHNLSSTLNADPNAVSVFSTLEPYLSSNAFQFIGTTSRKNYVKYIQPNESFTKNFDIVEMPEATDDETILIIAEVLKARGLRKNALVTYKAVLKAIDFSKAYVHISVLPDKAVELVLQSLSKANNSGENIADVNLVASIVSESVGVPVNELTKGDKEKLKTLEDTLHKRIIGQNYAIEKITSAIKRSRVRIRDTSKPIASFLFVGPTGVGKTETAKALASSYYGSEKEMIRLDMSEYQEIDSIKRLIGTEDGSTIGILTSSINDKPHSLVLIDEVEKAHSKIQYLFLQILDDGRLTDALGRTVNFSDAFIIMTSNVGTREIVSAIEQNKSDEDIHNIAINELKKYFAPEFLNRFTDLIPFYPLTKDQIFEITKLKVNKVIENLKDKHIDVTFTDEVIRDLSLTGYAPEWGARYLNRVIEEKVETMLADKIINDEIHSGDSIIIDHL